jgi:hypothetical protein
MRKHQNQTQQKTGAKGNTRKADKDQANGDRRHKETGTHRRAPLSLLSVVQPPSVSHDFRVPPIIPSTLSLLTSPSIPPPEIKIPRKSETRIPRPRPRILPETSEFARQFDPPHRRRPHVRQPALTAPSHAAVRGAESTLGWEIRGNPRSRAFRARILLRTGNVSAPHRRGTICGAVVGRVNRAAGLPEWSTWSEGSLSLGRRSGADLSGSSISVRALPGSWLNILRVSAGSYAPLFCVARRSAFVADALIFYFWLQASTYRAARRWLSSWYEIIWYCSWTIFLSRGSIFLTFGISLFHMHTYLWSNHC